MPASPWCCICSALDDGEVLRALVPLPQQIERFIRLPGDRHPLPAAGRSGPLFLDRLFPGFRVDGTGMFRVIRDSDMDIDEEAEDLVRVFETRAEAPPPRPRRSA